MPNTLNASGLTTKTYAELVSELTTALQTAYGADISLDSDTPDGQALNIFIQSVLDLLDLLVQVNNNFDPDNATGVVLDQRIALNAIQRQAATNTITNVSIVTSQALNLNGLDDGFPGQPIYTVADNAGNQFQLIVSQTIAAPGTTVAAFQAVTPGAVLTVPNTITTPVTIALGVTSVNNPTTYTSLGLDEESDAAVKVRRQKSTAISSKGYLDGLLAALENINGVTAAFVYENTSSTTDADSIPGHSIWVIVNGGANADIAQAIYSKRNAGCGMKGSVTYNITQLDDSLFTVKWDIVVAEVLYIEFDATSINGVDSIDSANIKAKIVTMLTPGVHETLDINELATIVQQIDPNCLVTNAGLSIDNSNFFNTLTPSAKNKQFSISAINIDITVV